MAAHENLSRRPRQKSSSPRQFGFVFAALSILLGLLPLLTQGAPHWWLVGAGLLLAGVALATPSVLTAPNRAWTGLAAVLNRVVSTIIVTLIYFVVVTPVGIWMRLRGKDSLRRRFAPDAPTYWLERESPSPTASSLRQQY